MNLTTNKNNKMNSLMSHFSDSEKRGKSNDNNSQENNNSIQIKRTSSVSRNNKNNKKNRNNNNTNYYNSIYKMNKANTIIHYNINNNKRKKNVSLNSSNKTIYNKNHLQKNRIINDLSDYSTMSNPNNEKYNKKKDWIAYIQSKTQRARDYSMIVKKNNMCSINHNSDRRLSSSSKSKSRNTNKIKGRANSNVTIGKSSLIDDISFWINKINFKNGKKILKEIKKININNIVSKEKNNNNNKTKKSRNLKHENISFKSSSIDNNKKNILSSSTLTMNAKTIYNQRNGNNKQNKINHKSNKKEYHKRNNFINNNINETIISNYAQIYVKKNHLKSSFENNNFTVNNQTIQPQKPLISSRINKKKIYSFKI